jgi:hypothetical protein
MPRILRLPANQPRINIEASPMSISVTLAIEISGTNKKNAPRVPRNKIPAKDKRDEKK